MRKALEGLKAEQGTTADRPALRVVFVPRFWGSFEARMELGKETRLPVTADARAHTLCGKPLAADDDGEPFPSRELAPGEPLPARICQRCRQSAGKRGYGQ